MALRLSDDDRRNIWRRIKVAMRYADKVFVKKAERAERLYSGEHYPDMDKRSDQPRIVVNYILPAVETLVKTVSFSYPKFTLAPMNEDGEKNREMAEQAIRYEWRVSHCQRECRRALRDKAITNLGVCFTGWKFEVKGQDPDDVEPSPDIQEDRFYVRRIPPTNFFLDPDCDSVLDNASYCGHWEQRPILEVQRDKRYQNTEKLQADTRPLAGYYSAADFSDPAQNRKSLASNPDMPPDLKRVRLYHYYERKRRIHLIYGDGALDPIFEESWSWPWDRYPYRVMHGPVTEDEFYGIPMVLRVEHPQQEINEARTQLSVQRKIGSPCYQMVGATLDQKQKRQLKAGFPNRVVDGLQTQLLPVPHIDIQPEVYEAETRAVQDMQFILGLNEYQAANPPSKRVTTTEVEAIQQAGGARASSDQQEFEQFCSEVALDCLNWLQVYSKKTRKLPIYNEDTNKVQEFRDFTAEEIRGDYLVEVFVGSTSAPNQQDQIKNIGFLIQSLQPFADAYGMDLRPLLKNLIKAIPNLGDVSEILDELSKPLKQPEQPQPQQPPGQQIPPEMIAAMQQQAMMAQQPPAIGAGGLSPEEQLIQLLMQQQQGGIPPEGQF